MATKEEILESIANMSVMEIADLIKMMEEKFGVELPDCVGCSGAWWVMCVDAVSPQGGAFAREN